MMTKMKLVPAEAVDEIKLSAYTIAYDLKAVHKKVLERSKNIIQNAPTVEVAEAEELFEQLTTTIKEEHGLEISLKYQPCVATVIKYLTESGYMIIRKVDDEQN